MDKHILKLLKAVWAPKQVVVMYCQGHQKGEMIAVRGNGKADWKAKPAALTGGQTSASLAAALFLSPLSEWDLWHTSQEQAPWFQTEGENFLPDGLWKFTDGCIAIPELLAPTFVKLTQKNSS
jgi:hypothetical protein